MFGGLENSVKMQEEKNSICNWHSKNKWYEVIGSAKLEHRIEVKTLENNSTLEIYQGGPGKAQRESLAVARIELILGFVYHFT